MEINQENVQAVVIMGTSNKNFTPISNNLGMGLLPVAGVPLIHDILESLALGGVGETILFCCQDGPKIKEYIRQCVEAKAEWSVYMDVQVMMSDTCRTLGDVMREIDASGLIKGHFVLSGVNSITNIPYAALLEQHKQTFKEDNGAAMTLVYKKVSWEHPLMSSDKLTFLAADARTNKVLMYQKYKPKSPERTISWTMEMVLNHSRVKLHHNLADANIALCSLAVPPLFSDNVDFQTRDDFIHGILTDEKKLTSSLYYILLKGNQYAAAGSIMGNRNLRENTPTLGRSCYLVEDVTSSLMIGNNCVIGSNGTITRSRLRNNVVVNGNCRITDSFIDNNSVINENCVLERAHLPPNTVVPAGSHIVGSMLQSSDANKERTLLNSKSESVEWENESTANGGDNFIGSEKTWSDSESCCSSYSNADSLPDSPTPDDTNIFLQEVIDSLARGYEEKLKCDSLTLEINSSRYAYNIQFHEVNFFVVRALISMLVLSDTKNVLGTVKAILKLFRPVLANYIKTKSSIMDCLRAVEGNCIKCEWLDGKCDQIINLHYFCKDISQNMVYPLSIQTGSSRPNDYLIMGNHNLRDKTSTLSRTCSSVEKVLIGAQTILKETIITNSVIGNNCLIDDNVTITNSTLKNNIIVKQGCRFNNSVIDNNSIIHESCVMEGAVLGTNVIVQSGTHMTG